jgi:hypothetical protein
MAPSHIEGAKVVENNINSLAAAFTKSCHPPHWVIDTTRSVRNKPAATAFRIAKKMTHRRMILASKCIDEFISMRPL